MPATVEYSRVVRGSGRGSGRAVGGEAVGEEPAS
jgi:hypothetical protein